MPFLTTRSPAILRSPATSSSASTPVTSYPAGYRWGAVITVTGGSAPVGGSASVASATGADYVVSLHLTGTTASTVWAGITDQTNMTDVAVWWYNGSGYTQIDYDVDKTTNGAWSSSNITLWFKLQATLAASPATDANYLLTWGKIGAASLTTMQTWAHIYPTSDGFDGVQGSMGTTASVLGASWTKSTAANGTISVASGNLTIAAASNASALSSYVSSATSYGQSYAIGTSMKYGTAPASGSTVAVGPTGAKYAIAGVIGAVSTANYSGTQTLGVSGQSNTGSVAVLGTASFQTIWVSRTAAGAPYFSVGTGAFVAIGTNALTTAYPAVLDVANAASAAQTGTFDWIKVRPWIPTEPTTALGTIYFLDLFPVVFAVMHTQASNAVYRM